MEIKNNDFVKIEFDLYANDKLVQTTNEKKAKDAGLKIENKGPMTIIVGKRAIVKAVDEDMLNVKDNKTRTLELSPENAYGKRDNKNIKMLPKSAFTEHEMRAVPGMVYDFNGMFGTVKSVVGGRVMVDFNNVLAGKNIKVEYSIVEKIEDVKEKIIFIFENVLKLPQKLFRVDVEDKEVGITVPEELAKMQDVLKKSLEEFISDIKDYNLKIQNFKNK